MANLTKAFSVAFDSVSLNNNWTLVQKQTNISFAEMLLTIAKNSGYCPWYTKPVLNKLISTFAKVREELR